MVHEDPWLVEGLGRACYLQQSMKVFFFFFFSFLVRRKALLLSNVTSEDWSSRKFIEKLTPVAMPDMSQLIWLHQPYPQEDWQGRTARIQDPNHFSK